MNPPGESTSSRAPLTSGLRLGGFHHVQDVVGVLEAVEKLDHVRLAGERAVNRDGYAIGEDGHFRPQLFTELLVEGMFGGLRGEVVEQDQVGALGDEGNLCAELVEKRFHSLTAVAVFLE